MKITYFAVKKEFAKNKMVLNQLSVGDRCYVKSFIKSTVCANKKHTYKDLFEAILASDDMKEKELDSVLPNYHDYEEMIQNTKNIMEITPEEEAEILYHRGTNEERKYYTEDEIEFADCSFQMELMRRDKSYKRLKKKKYFE